MWEICEKNGRLVIMGRIWLWKNTGKSMGYRWKIVETFLFFARASQRICPTTVPASYGKIDMLLVNFPAIPAWRCVCVCIVIVVRFFFAVASLNSLYFAGSLSRGRPRLQLAHVLQLCPLSFGEDASTRVDSECSIVQLDLRLQIQELSMNHLILLSTSCLRKDGTGGPNRTCSCGKVETSLVHHRTW